MPERAIGAGDRGHRLGLVDRAEQCPPYRDIIEGRMQMVEARDAHGRRKVGNHRDVAVAGERLGLWSLRGTSHQSTSPLRSAADAEN